MVKYYLKYFSILLLALLCAYYPCIASPDTPSKRNSDENALNISVDGALQDSNLIRLSRYQMEVSIEESKSKVKEQQYYQESLEHRHQVFNWQHYSGIIIFVIVILIVIAGVVFSGIQFSYSLKDIKLRQSLLKKINKSNVPGTSKVELPQDSKSEIELSLNSIKVNTSLVGIIILTISIVFFYLYLSIVYPIKEIKADSNFQNDRPKK